MDTPWLNVYKSKEYQSLPLDEQVQAKLQYFSDVVAPEIDSSEITEARRQFIIYTNDLDRPKPGILSDIGAGASRLAGGVLGTANAPLAFIQGMQNAPYVEGSPEEWNKLPWYKKPLVMLGGGFESAYRSATKEGDFGEQYDSYYKAKTGNTLEQDFGKGANYLRLALDLTRDPMFGPLIAVDMAKQGIRTVGAFANYIRRGTVPMGTKEMIAVPKGMLSDINNLEKLDLAEKQALQQQVIDLIKKRGIDQNFVAEAGALDAQKALPPGQGFELVSKKPIVEPLPEAKVVPAPKEIVEPGATSGGKQPWEMTKEEFRKTWDTPEFRKEFPDYKGQQDHGALVAEAVDTGKPVPPEVLKDYPELAKGGLAMHGVGAVAGVDVDEDGNLTYDFAKGAGGTILGAGALKLAPFLKKSVAAQKLFAKNPGWGKVHDMIGKDKSSFTLMGLWNGFMKVGIDRFHPIKDLSPATYDKAIKFQSYKDVASIKIKDLEKVFEPFGKKDEVLVTDYILAKRALNRAENGIQNPNNVGVADAQKAIAEMETHYASQGGDVAKLKTASAGFHNWTQKNILKEALDNGFISQEAFDKIRANNQFYATFDVLDHLPEDINKLPQMPSGEYFSQANQAIIKAMKGTEKAIADPLEATVRKFVSAQAAFARNRVASLFIDDPATSQIVRPFAQNAKEFQIMTAQGKNPVTAVPKDWDTINRFKDGFVEKYVAPKEYTEAMKQMTPWEAPQVVQALNSIFRSSATTLYLPFTIGNAFRDAFMAFVTSPAYRGKEAIKFPVDWTKGLYEGLKYEFANKSPVVEGYLKSGGGFGWSGEVRDVKAVKEKLFSGALDVIKNQANLFKQVEKLSGAVELAPRLGIYERAIQQGASMEEAATLARKGTIDFNRAGSATKVFNQFVPFLNARVQSRVLMVESLKRDPSGTMAKAFVSTVLPGAALYAYNRQYYSDLYDDIPDYTRQNYFTFITGTATDEKGKVVPKYFVIPKGDIGQMVWNPIEHAIDKMWNKDPKSTGEFLMQFASDVSPIGFARDGELSGGMLASNITPPIVKGVVEDITNKILFTGQEIVPYFTEKNKPLEMQFKEKTPESYKWIANQLKDVGIVPDTFKSPLRLQNFMSSIFAGYGREGLDPSAMMKGLSGRFYKESGGQKERDTWDIIKDIETGYNTTRAYAEQFVKDNDRASALKLMQKWNDGMDKQIDRMAKEGIADKGGVRKDYYFTFEKMKGVMRSGVDQRTSLQKKISVK